MLALLWGVWRITSDTNTLVSVGVGVTFAVERIAQSRVWTGDTIDLPRK